jgi:hypothetical protein
VLHVFNFAYFEPILPTVALAKAGFVCFAVKIDFIYSQKVAEKVSPPESPAF